MNQGAEIYRAVVVVLLVVVLVVVLVVLVVVLVVVAQWSVRRGVLLRV